MSSLSARSRSRPLAAAAVLSLAACADAAGPFGPGVAHLAITAAVAELAIDDTLRLAATVRWRGRDVGSPPVTWASSDTALATVSAEGLVTARNAGRVVIGATAGMLQTAVALTVTLPLPRDVGAGVERLGNPFTDKPVYSRNVWDMQRFEGRVFLGHGNSAGNHGPIPLWALDPATGAFASEGTVDGEQVDVFRIIDGALYVPDHDPRDPWELGNFYRREQGVWTKHRTIPWGVHTFDMAAHRGRLFAALGADWRPGRETLVMSTDRGATWQVVTGSLQRFTLLFELQGVLYAHAWLWNDPDPSLSLLLRFDGERFVPSGVPGSALLPGMPGNWAGHMLRAVEFRGALLYTIGAGGGFGWRPHALAVAERIDRARRVVLPDSAAVPYDLLVRDGTAYLLAATRQPAGGYLVAVYATRDLAQWWEVLHFVAPTFARSFEEVDGDFFFGLGSFPHAVHPATGDVLRVRRALLARP